MLAGARPFPFGVIHRELLCKAHRLCSGEPIMPILANGQTHGNWILTPEDHVQTLHPLTGTGLVTVAILAGG